VNDQNECEKWTASTDRHHPKLSQVSRVFQLLCNLGDLQTDLKCKTHNRPWYPSSEYLSYPSVLQKLMAGLPSSMTTLWNEGSYSWSTVHSNPIDSHIQEVLLIWVWLTVLVTKLLFTEAQAKQVRLVCNIWKKYKKTQRQQWTSMVINVHILQLQIKSISILKDAYNF